ncbi:hypothetical protein [Azospirillum sp. TSO35-2]|uniref:hypothetical protein n=1 Tax=Azospirillum sp. TSO35-2 TaxID=716796 RepID=UPI001304D3D9|nr:hypothetical protein [Azospirillum sp. TSO35-2]
MTTPSFSTGTHFAQRSASPSAPLGMAAARLAEADSRFQPQSSGLTKRELRQIVLDILG